MIKPPSEFMTIEQRIADFLRKSYEEMLRRSINKILPQDYKRDCFINCSPDIWVTNCGDIALNKGGNLHNELIKQLKEKYGIEASIGYGNGKSELNITFKNLLDIISEGDYHSICAKTTIMIEHHIGIAISEGKNSTSVGVGRKEPQEYWDRILGIIFKNNEHYKYKYKEVQEGWYRVYISW